MKTLKAIEKNSSIDVGNWANAKDLFPTIEVNQETCEVTVTYFDCDSGKYPNRRIGETVWHRVDIEGDQMFVRGETNMKNYKRWQGTGSQQFCYAVFAGDSSHIYVHRATASNGWMEANATEIRSRLVKLGIGATKGVIQQGDFLLKPANGNAYPDEDFKHETMGAGHHKFEMPVLYATGNKGRQYKITEPTRLIHEATDDIQHPDVVVPSGIYIVGTTANSLNHDNKRD